mmetsp:Transcript_14070/g.27494  ORF Transcript_14070/g.27494 Transcript_14070/m.27494 type:complete len:169 (+) Transcript_14070:30-536(+)
MAEAEAEPLLHHAATIAATLLAAAGLYHLLFWNSRLVEHSNQIDLRNDSSGRYFRALLDPVDLSTSAGVGNGYRWTQTDTEVTIRIAIGAKERAKDVEINLSEYVLHVRVAGEDRLQGTLLHRVKKSDFEWEIEGSAERRALYITLTKKSPTRGANHWRCIFSTGGTQ